MSFTQPRDLRTGYYDCSYDIADSAIFTQIAITVTLNGVTVDTVTGRVFHSSTYQLTLSHFCH